MLLNVWQRIAVVLGLAVAFASAQAPARIRGPVELRQTVRLRGNTVWRARHALDQGPAPADLPMRHMLLLLKPSSAQKMALEDLLSAQREQDSPQYHHWLTPQEFGQRFGPAPSDIATVEQWLQGQGFQVERVSPGGLVIEFSGTAATVRQALHTSIHRYQVQRPGAAPMENWANAGDPAIPAALAPVVAGVVSLGNFFKTPMVHLLGKGTEPRRQAGKPTPELNYTGSDGQTENALVPGDFQTIYNVPSTLNGNGETIAVVARSEVVGSDFTQWRALFLPKTSGTLNTIVATSTSPGATGDEDQQEATLDVEWAGAAAPDATIDLVVAASSDTTDGVDLSALYIVNHDLAPIMSTSFGQCESQMGATENQFWNNLWEQAAAEGISVFVSAGDNGPAACDAASAATAENGLAVSGLASTPYDTAVGGSEFDETLDNGNDSTYWSQTSQSNYSSALGYIPEVPWNEHGEAIDGGGLWSGSGGTSSVYARPVWQSPLVPGMSAQPGQARLLPDMALAAAGHDGYVVCEGGSCTETSGGFEFFVISGTSASSPAMASIMALVDQKLGGRQGLANPVLYRLASIPSDYPAVFHDVTQGNTDIPCAADSPDCPSSGTFGYSATVGYDLATGLGSLNVTSLVDDWSSVGFAASQTALTLSLPASPVYGQSVPLTIAVTSSGASGPVPTGPVELWQQASGGAQTLLQTFTLDANGQISASTALLPAGSYAVVALYGGDGIYGASTSPPVTMNIAKQNVTVTLTISLPGSTQPVTSAIYGDLLQISAVASDAGDQPLSGAMLSFSSTTAGQQPRLLGPVTTDASGAAAWSGQSPGSPGLDTIVASFSGDGNHNAAASAPAVLQVSASPTTTTILSDQDDTLQVIIQGQSTGIAPQGSLSLYAGGQEINYDYAGLVSVSKDPASGLMAAHMNILLQPIAGTAVAVTVQFKAASPGFLASTSAPFSIATPPNLVFAPASLNFGPIAYGQTSQPQTVTLTNEGGEVASLSLDDTAAFFPMTSDCGVTLAALASCTASVAFQATPSVPPSGAQGSIADTYYGRQAELTGTVVAFMLTPPATLSTTNGGTVTGTFPVQPYGGFSGPVTLSCSQLPPFAQCSFNPPVVQLDGNSTQTVTLTITTTAPAGGATGGTMPSDWSEWAGLLLLTAAACAFELWRQRKRPAVLAATAGVALVLAAIACGGGAAGGTVPPPPSGGNAQPPPNAILSAGQFDFGKIGVGTTSPSQAFTLTNSGGQELILNSIAITGAQKADFQLSTLCPASLMAGSLCQALVTLLPKQAGAESATLVFTDNSVPTTQTVALTGTGVTITPPGRYAVLISGTSGGQTHTVTATLYVN